MININFSLSYVEIYLLISNIIAFLSYGFDKLQAVRSIKLSRVPEIRLLIIALLSGSIGSLIAMILFRHKIKKISFVLKLLAVILLQLFGYYYFIG